MKRRNIFAVICRHEWRLLAADRVLIPLLFIFLTLLGYAAYRGGEIYRVRQQSIEKTIAEENENRESRKRHVEALEAGQEPEKNLRARYADRPHTANTTAILPPLPLTIISLGDIAQSPPPVQISHWTEFTPQLFAVNSVENPLTLAAGRFDVAFVLIFALPLLLLAFTYDVVSAEREGGTLALVASQPVSLRTHALAKLLVRGMTILVPAIVLPVIAVLLTAGFSTLLDNLPSLLLFAGVITVYSLFWLSFSLLVNSLGKSSATNALIVGSFWLTLLVIVPGLFNLFVQTRFPLTSRTELAGKIQAVQRETQESSDALKKQLMADYLRRHPELKVPEKEQIQWAESNRQSVVLNEYNYKQSKPDVERRTNQLAARRQFVNTFGYLSPAVLMQNALDEIAGTGETRFQHFESQIRLFGKDFSARYVPMLFAEQKLTARDYDEMPRFNFAEEPFSKKALRVFLLMLGIILPLVLVTQFALKRIRN